MNARIVLLIVLLSAVSPAWGQSVSGVLENTRKKYTELESLKLKVHYHFESSDGIEDMEGTFIQNGENCRYELEKDKIIIRKRDLSLTINNLQKKITLERDSSSLENTLINIPVSDLLGLFNNTSGISEEGDSYRIDLERIDPNDTRTHITIKIDKETSLYRSFTIKTFLNDSLFYSLVVSLTDIEINEKIPEKLFDHSPYINFSGNSVQLTKAYSGYNFTKYL